LGYFSDGDKEKVEALVYDSSLKPSFEVIKSCLIWKDECPPDLTPEGYERLCDLWIARSFIHQNRAFSDWEIDPSYFEKVWTKAREEGIKWPGFNRIELTTADREYLYENLRSLEKEDDY
jgi:hypothetical protein